MNIDKNHPYVHSSYPSIKHNLIILVLPYKICMHLDSMLRIIFLFLNFFLTCKLFILVEEISLDIIILTILMIIFHKHLFLVRLLDSS